MASTLEKAKYQRIAHSLREQIRNGDLRPGDRLPSFSEMHAQHGATTTTVERSYTILQQEGLVKREKGRGVFVAQPEPAPTTGTIGVFGIGLTDMNAHPWHMHLLTGIRKMAQQAGKEILLYPFLPDADLKWEKVDGILNLDPNFLHIVPYLPPNMPFISALTKIAGHTSVVPDEASGIRQAVRHLVELGHRRIAYLIMHGVPELSFLTPRITAYQDALREVGIKPDIRWLRRLEPDNPHYQENGHHEMKQWLGEDWHELGCTALLTQNDDVAIGAMQALQQSGMSVPDDVSVIGFDGTEIGKYCLPHLTSVALPLDEIGAQAMDFLLRIIKEEPVPFSTLELPTSLIIRRSTTVAKTN